MSRYYVAYGKNNINKPGIKGFATKKEAFAFQKALAGEGLFSSVHKWPGA